jgi:hypothetical protein
MADVIGADWDGRHYELDIATVTPREFKAIKSALGMKAGQFIRALSDIDDLDADVATALLWLFRKRAGVHQGTIADFDDDFPMFGLLAAMAKAGADSDSDDSDGDADPKAGSSTGASDDGATSSTSAPPVTSGS